MPLEVQYARLFLILYYATEKTKKYFALNGKVLLQVQYGSKLSEKTRILETHNLLSLKKVSKTKSE